MISILTLLFISETGVQTVIPSEAYRMPKECTDRMEAVARAHIHEQITASDIRRYAELIGEEGRRRGIRFSLGDEEGRWDLSCEGVRIEF